MLLWESDERIEDGLGGGDCGRGLEIFAHRLEIFAHRGAVSPVVEEAEGFGGEVCRGGLMLDEFPDNFPAGEKVGHAEVGDFDHGTTGEDRKSVV